MLSSSTRYSSDSLFRKNSYRDSSKVHVSDSDEIDMINIFTHSAFSIFFFLLSHVTAFVDFLTDSYDILYHHDLADLFPMLFGLMLCFFGGHYLMIFTILETVRLFCWKELTASMHILRHNYKIAMESSRKDDLIDANGNRIPDIQEINRQDLLLRKLKIFMKTVDVVEVRHAIRTLASAYFTTIATLRLKMARYIALALSSARAIGKNIPLESVLAQHLPPESKKWSGILADTLLNVLCMTLALFIGRWVASLNCAIQGSHMFVLSVSTLSQKKGLLVENLHPSDPRSRVLVVVVAVTGFLWQVSHSSGLPFPINFILFPLTFLEWLLQVIVSGLIFLTPTIV